MGRYYREYGSKCVSLYNYHEGRVLPVAQAASEPARNHRARARRTSRDRQGLQERDRQPLQLRAYRGPVPNVRNRLPNYFRKVTRTLEDEIEYLTRYLEGKLPKGIIHGDLFADNLLFRGEKLTAVLDFEAACRGKFIFDIATAVNALCFVDGGYSLDRFRYVLHGYESVRTLSLAEWDAFPNELRYSSLRFTVTRLHDFFLKPVDGRESQWTRISASSSIVCGFCGARKKAGWRRC